MPVITVISGAKKPRRYRFPSASITLGKGPGCDLAVEESGISPVQAIIAREEGGYVIRNRGESLATFVNGLPCSETELIEGDEIAFGRTTLIFDPARDETGVPEEEVRVVSPRMLETTVDSTLPAGDSPTLPEAREGETKTRRSLTALFEAGKIIHSIHDTDLLIERLVNLLLEVCRASRACFLEYRPEDGSFHPRAVARRGEEEGKDAILISRTIIDHAAAARTGILCTNALLDDRFRNATSVSLGKIRSAICLPVGWKDRLFGLLYLDNRAFTRDFTSFGEDDLRLVIAIANQAAIALDNASREGGLRRENASLRRRAQSSGGIVAASPAMRRTVELIGRVAPTGSTVLIRGETGTGKEVVARAVHANSPRRNGPLVAVNCAALPETLLQSELFGHEKGAFTGALARKTGKFELARGGTIFLDEIGELDPQSQVVLLRILEEKKFQRLGGNEEIAADVRVIAATSRDLDRAIAGGEFREDLYYRLKVVEIFIAPLRERPEDIEPLVDHYLEHFSREGLRRPTGIEPEALSLLQAHPWPGNVRELKNALERALVLGSSPAITPADLAFLEPKTRREAGDGATMRDREREQILDTLRRTGGNKKLAAARLGINRATLHRKIKLFGISASAR